MRRLFQALLFGAAALLAACAGGPAADDASSPEPAEVAVIAAMHGFHADHPGYDYEALYALVRAYDPDAVGVEIRAEDLERPRDYLASNYPREMIALADAYAGRVFGFDWLGAELERRAVPDGWWREQSEIKALERAFDAEPDFPDAQMTAFDDAQLALFEEATPEGLHDGRYDDVTERKYAYFRERVAGTPYERLGAFYAERDRRIAEAIRAEAAARPGQRIVVVLGADHRAATLEALRADPSVRLRAVPPPGFD
ncbi:hypothetical protein DDZ18_12770 [Marinicauda salina]|uniref:Haem-binding uptake Tiki superfamily ChaN domain-containing protein n=1 Tax=Marinicauda salina TaxID=2135793 RepID=A0A2U2BRL5_9PROT|nr:hypothetical protein [Marinicauda salina]PWE16629.1 hypothetical protein DDZ18_12770 [Marinicauda salina]